MDFPPTPADHAEPRPSRSLLHPNSPLSLGFTLLVILAATATVFMMQAHGRKGVAFEDVPPDPSQVSSLEIKLLGRYMIGADTAFGAMSAQEAEAAKRQLFGVIESSADDPTTRLRVAMVAQFLDMDDAAQAQVAAVRNEAAAMRAPVETPPPNMSIDERIRIDALESAWTGFEIDTHALQGLLAGEGISDDARTRLLDRHHWFARVALAADMPDTDPEVRAIRAQGMRTLISIVCGAAIGVTAILLGTVLFFVGAVKIANGRLRRALPAAHVAGPRGALLEAFALFLLMFIGIHTVTPLVLGPMQLGPDVTRLVSVATSWLMLLAAFWPLARGWRWGDLTTALGWRRARGIVREMGAGVVGYLACIPIMLFGIALTFVLMALQGGPGRSHPAADELAQGVGWIGAIALLHLGTNWAPVVEETLFRGAFYFGLRRALGVLLSALCVGLIFALLHPPGIIAVPALTSIAVVFALLREWRGSLIAPITAHAMHNGFIFTMILLALS